MKDRCINSERTIDMLISQAVLSSLRHLDRAASERSSLVAKHMPVQKRAGHADTKCFLPRVLEMFL